MSLNDTKIRSLKPSEKPFKVTDSHGLYLLVNPGGSSLWYLKYRINRKESRLGLGAYPDVSLAYARQLRDGIRKLLAQNINPAQQRIADKAARSPEKTFKHVALSWHKASNPPADAGVIRAPERALHQGKNGVNKSLRSVRRKTRFSISTAEIARSTE